MPRSSCLRKAGRTGVLMGVCAVAGGALFNISAVSQTPRAPARPPDATRGGASLVRQGRQIFRFDDFGDNKFWSGALQLEGTPGRLDDFLRAFALGPRDPDGGSAADRVGG